MSRIVRGREALLVQVHGGIQTWSALLYLSNLLNAPLSALAAAAERSGGQSSAQAAKQVHV